MNQGISGMADVWNMFFFIVHVLSWCIFRHKQPHTCSHTLLSSSTQPSLFPCQLRRPARLHTNRSSFTTTTPRYHTEFLSKDFQLLKKKPVSPPAPQIHKVIEACAWRMIHAALWRERERKRHVLVICILQEGEVFLLIPLIKTLFLYFSSLGWKRKPLSLIVRKFKRIQTSLHQSKQHHSTHSRCLYYIRQYITSHSPAPPILTS